MNTYQQNIRRVTLILLCAFVVASTNSQAQAALGVEGQRFRLNPHPDPANKQFGYRQVVGDFDGNGVDDVVIAERTTGERLRLYLGNPWTIGSNAIFPFNASTITTPAFSDAIAAGDFNGDGRDELALAARFGGAGLSVGGHVSIMQRSAGGAWSVQQTIRQGLGTYAGIDETSDNYGSAVAIGDFNNDGYDDLAIGIRLETPDGTPGSTGGGAVHVVYGSAAGLTGTNDRMFTPADIGLAIIVGKPPELGSALAAGDFDGDGKDDLAMGAPYAPCPANNEVGAVGVVRGSASGLTTVDAHLLQPGVDGMPGDCASTRKFGAVLASGRFNLVADGLVIGAPESTVAGVVLSGEVHILPSSSEGPTATGAQSVSLANLPGGTLQSAFFGNQLAVGRLRTGRASVVISGHLEDVEDVQNAGAVRILHKSSILPGPFDLAGSERWTASTRLGVGAPDTGDTFGTCIGIGDFNGDNLSDLVIGIPSFDDGVDQQVGGTQTLYQSEFIFRDGFD